MSRFSLNLNIGEAATATVCFDLESDGEDCGIAWPTLEVWYKGIDIVDTLDLNDLNNIDCQVKRSWDEIENQIKEYWHD